MKTVVTRAHSFCCSRKRWEKIYSEISLVLATLEEGILPVSMKYEGIIIVQFLCLKFILLSSLILNIVTVTTGEHYLVSIVDITTNLAKHFLKYFQRFLYFLTRNLHV